MKIQDWLNKPYPFIKDFKYKLILVFGFGIFTYLFLMIYLPFGAAEIRENRAIFLMGFGVCVASGLVITYIILPKLFPGLFDERRWQIKKEIPFLIFNFFLISVFNYSYNSTVGANIARQNSFPEFFGITLAVGIFPVIIMTFLIELFLNRRNIATAQQLSEQIPEGTNEKPDAILKIQPETSRSPALRINTQDFLFAVSENNYSTVYYRNAGALQKELLRLSLKNLEKQLSNVEGLIRCHRSYIVNKFRIQQIRGNARALVLFLDGYDDPIPVSRNFSREKLQ